MAELAGLPGGTGGVMTPGDIGGPVNTGVWVNHIVNVYRAGGGRLDEVEYREVLARYLRWMRSAMGKVVLRGIKRREEQAMELDLSDVYLPLSAEALPELREQLKRERSGQKIDSGGAPERPISMRELLAQGDRIALIGGPGCGKTTVLQHIAWTLAEALTTGDARIAADRLGLTGELPLPILVPLSSFNEHRRQFAGDRDKRAAQLATFINGYLLERQAGLNLPEDFFATLLDQGRHVIVLLDGLDEVPTEDDRALVSQAVSDLTHGRENARFVVTSRTRAYEGEAVLRGGFRVVRVLPLEPEAVRDLIGKAYGAIYPTPEEKDERERVTADLVAGVERLEEERAARLGRDEQNRLVTSPLMVRMLLIAHFNLRRMPDQRAELYEEVAKTLLTSEYNPDAVVAQLLAKLGGDWRLRRDLCQFLAFSLHSKGREAGREIRETDLTELLAAYLQKSRRKSEDDAAILVADFVLASRLRGGLLEERDGRYAFSHLSFQEFLAARYLAEGKRSTDAIVAFLEEDSRVSDSWWREVALLTVGYLNLSAEDTAIELIGCLAHLGDAEPPVTRTELASAELAATAFLEWDGSAATRQALSERLAELLKDRQLTGASPAMRAAAGSVMGRLDDPRRGVGILPADGDGEPAVPDIAWCEVPAGPFLLGANADEPSDDDEFQHEQTLPTFYIGRFLVTNAQYGAFREVGGYDDERWWTKAGWSWRSANKVSAPSYWDNERFSLPNQPVVGVTWHEAMAYTAWLEARLRDSAIPDAASARSPDVAQLLSSGGWRLRLPSEAEWEKAAGWDGPARHKRVYAWGDGWKPELANVEGGIGRPSAVGIFPLDESPSGALDMTGNVWEWTRSLYKPYPYRADDGREDPSAAGSRVLRGGSWSGGRRSARVSCRDRGDAADVYDDVGFRVVVAPVLS
jgi:formylglycine-generating enzyme required for sulfatase activity/energy-coupling factor transporter ATP-binding protein EcfA2